MAVKLILQIVTDDPKSSSSKMGWSLVVVEKPSIGSNIIERGQHMDMTTPSAHYSSQHKDAGYIYGQLKLDPS
jgi:hypothetical protein